MTPVERMPPQEQEDTGASLRDRALSPSATEPKVSAFGNDRLRGMDAVFARAKGPRQEIVGTDDFPCPWCGRDCAEVFDDDPVTTCPHCRREFLCPDEDGRLICVGLISPADQKYLDYLASIRPAQCDGSPEGRDAAGGSGEADSAVPKGCATTLTRGPAHE